MPASDDLANLDQIRRRRRFWGIISFVALLTTMLALFGMQVAPSTPTIYVLAAGAIASAGSGPMFAWYEIKVIRIKQRLALPG